MAVAVAVAGAIAVAGAVAVAVAVAVAIAVAVAVAVAVARNVSSQLQVCGVRLVDPRQEALQGKAGRYATLGHGEEVYLGVEELCGHSHETIAIKGE